MTPAPTPSPSGFRNLEDEVRELERTRMIAALMACEGNQTRAAELIGMPRRTFVSKLRAYEIRRKDDGTFE